MKWEITKERDNLRLLRSHFELGLETKKEVEIFILDEELRKEAEVEG